MSRLVTATLSDVRDTLESSPELKELDLDNAGLSGMLEGTGFDKPELGKGFAMANQRRRPQAAVRFAGDGGCFVGRKGRHWG